MLLLPRDISGSGTGNVDLRVATNVATHYSLTAVLPDERAEA